MTYKDSIDLIDTVDKCLVIFSIVGQLTKAAEVPDQHMGGPGCVENGYFGPNFENCIVYNCIFSIKKSKFEKNA